MRIIALSKICLSVLLILLLYGISYAPIVAADAPPLEAAMISLDHQLFPFIYLSVAVNRYGEGISTLTKSNFQVTENGVLQTDYFDVVPPQAGGGVRVVDIVFLMDNSGSMIQEQNAVRDNVIEFVNDLVASDIDYALGLCRFGAYENGGNPIIEDNGTLSTDPEYFKNDVWNRNVIDGGHEPGWDALYEAANGFAFRPGSQKVFILITDECVTHPGDTNYGDYSYDDALNALTDKPITLFSLIDLDYTNSIEDYGTIAEATNGQYFDIYSSFDAILDYISSQVANAYRITYKSSNPAFDGVERHVVVTVSYQGDQATCDGTYTPGSAPRIQRTQDTLDLHDQAWAAGTQFTIKAEITDTVEPYVESATLYYRKAGDQTYTPTPMTHSSDIWAGTIPGSAVETPWVGYYITATDGESAVTNPSVNPMVHPHVLAILPNEAPQITHTPPADVPDDTPITITAQIVDTTNALASATLHYRKVGQLIYKCDGEMTNTGGDNYQDTIPSDFVTAAGVEYYILAVDDLGTESSFGTRDDPQQVWISTNKPPKAEIKTHVIDSANGTATFTWSGSDDSTLPAQLVYKHRLLNPDSPLYDWSDWSSSTTATYPRPPDSRLPAGTYRFQVKAKDADEAVQPNSATWGFTIGAAPPAHTVSTPSTPSGPDAGQVGELLNFSTGGSTCSQRHPVQYRFDWGEGDPSEWSSSTTASHSYSNIGTYQVRAQARCANDTSVISGWSAAESVTIGSTELPTVKTLPPSDPTLSSVIFKGAVNPNGLDTTTWFEWGKDASLSSFSSTSEQALGNGRDEKAVSAPLTNLDVGKPCYFRVVARNAAGIARSNIRRSLIILGTPPYGSKYPQYWNEFDRVICYWASQYNLYPPVLKAIIAHESHGLGKKYDSPCLSYLYEPVTVDERYVTASILAGTVPTTLSGYLLSPHPPDTDKNPYNRFWNELVPIPSKTTNKDMMSKSYLVNGKTLLYGLTNPSGTATKEFVAQYRLAASYGLSQVVYWWWHHLINDGAPESLYDPLVGIRVGAIVLNAYRNSCTPAVQASTENFEAWKTAVGVYNSGDTKRCWYSTSYVNSVRGSFTGCKPVLASDEFDPGDMLSPQLAAEDAVPVHHVSQPSAFPKIELLRSVETDIDRVAGDFKGTGEQQLAVLSPVLLPGEDPEEIVGATATLKVFSNEQGDDLEWESPTLPCTGHVGRVFLIYPPAGGPSLIAVECAGGAHGTWLYLFRWDGSSFKGVYPRGENGVELSGFFGDAGIQVHADGRVEVAQRCLDNPLDTTNIEIYEWQEKTYLWVGEETESNLPDVPPGPVPTEGAIICGPNPVRDNKVAFFYTLPEEAVTAEVLIVNVSGRLVAQLLLDSGSSRFPASGYWNPVDRDGTPLANGPYIYVLVVDGKATAQGKMVIQR